MTTKKILHLNLKKKWFDLILSGKKTIEYREIKPHWLSRFTTDFTGELGTYIKYDEIYFKNGMARNGKGAPFMRVEWKGLILEKFDGEKVRKKYFFGIILGKILETKNIQELGSIRAGEKE